MGWDKCRTEDHGAGDTVTEEDTASSLQPGQLPTKGGGGGEELLPKRLLKEHVGGGRDSGTGNTSV